MPYLWNMFRLVTVFLLALLVATHAFQPTARASKPSFPMLQAVHDDQASDRRVFLGSSLTFFLAAVSNPLKSFADGGAVDYKAVAADISDLVKENKDWGPTLGMQQNRPWSPNVLLINANNFSLVRLAWHSSGTYDKMSKTGGSGGGTIRFKEELAHGGNAGLGSTAVEWLQPVYEKYQGKISYADLYTLAGVTAIKTMGGPTIPWSSGRVDAMDPSAVTPDGRLPNADSGPKGADGELA